MNILVTGSRGFLGKALCKRLQNENHTVYGVHSENCDLRHQDSLDQFNAISFDLIYHLAAWTQAGDFCLSHSGEQWIINQQINTHTLTWWKERQSQAKLIAIGSSCGYDPSLPLVEENYLTGKPIDSLFTYAMTKRMLLNGLLAFHKQFSLDYLYLIPPTLYGPEYSVEGKQLHFIFDLIRKIICGKWHGTPVVLWGDGEQRRELLHVQDFVEALVFCSKHLSNTSLNIGYGEDKTIKTFANKISLRVGFPFDEILYDTSKYVGAKAKLLCIKKLKKTYPSFSRTSLDKGLEETVDYFLNLYKEEPWKAKISSFAVTEQGMNTAKPTPISSKL